MARTFTDTSSSNLNVAISFLESVENIGVGPVREELLDGFYLIRTEFLPEFANVAIIFSGKSRICSCELVAIRSSAIATSTRIASSSPSATATSAARGCLESSLHLRHYALGFGSACVKKVGFG